MAAPSLLGCGRAATRKVLRLEARGRRGALPSAALCTRPAGSGTPPTTGYGEGAFSLKSLLKNRFKAVLQGRNITTLPHSRLLKVAVGQRKINQSTFPPAA